VDLVERWWNGLQGNGRRDIWLSTDGSSWTVRGRYTDAGTDREVTVEFDLGWDAVGAENAIHRSGLGIQRWARVAPVRAEQLLKPI
jgi:hypothetical protein